MPNLLDTSATSRCLIIDLASLTSHKRLLVKVFGESNFPFQDILVDDHWVFISEGVNAHIHLIDKNAQCPPIDTSTMTLVENHLRSKVFRSSTKSICSGFYYFGETEVSQLQVSILSDEQVFRFQIPVNNIPFMKILKNESNLCSEQPKIEHNLTQLD
jgi:hypothetical protein